MFLLTNLLISWSFFCFYCGDDYGDDGLFCFSESFSFSLLTNHFDPFFYLEFFSFDTFIFWSWKFTRPKNELLEKNKNPLKLTFFF
jgi:membrane-bound metal-dependent hydrolase YbcI (DUF457 family)